ncbi:restriction endonuclease subunit S [Vibrio parahaemolyticus]|uniref:restriction endonuclease subunit S n=1 Tax=Vibrio parahaemolyticus TaxID=670 RepID=UPI00215BA9B5|nr:restriction endonuclease subunit S [Vibrio parahaemolyticus]MCS0012805.1 restriction endonuclease subunit S [Vibrio parahaemolyticus]
MVPNGWSNTCIDDNITFSGGAQPPREVFKFEPEEGYIRLIQIRDYKSDKFITYVPKKLAKKFCTADDVMIGRYGPPIFQILRGIEGAYNVALIKAIPKSGVDKEFMYYFLKRDPLLRVIESFSQRTSGQTGIEMDVLKAYPMHLPPLPEQRKIAQILSTWDRGIATTEKLIDARKQQKKALMQQLLTGKKRLVDPETGKKFEGDWEEVKLSHFFDRVTEKNKGQSTNVVTISAQHGLIRQEEFFKKSVASETLDNYFILRKGQFAYNKSYSNGYPMGAIKRLNRYEDAVVTSLYICFELKNEQLASSCFMEQYFESGLLNRGLTKVAAEGGRAHGLLNVKPSDFMALAITAPQLNEQQKIASVLTAADKEIELLEAKLVHFKQEKKALMQQLLTGKRRVKVEHMEEATC